MPGRRKQPPPRARVPPIARVPELIPCPTCGLRIQAGKGPGGVAWHECQPVEPVTLESTLQLILRKIHARASADRLDPSELAGLVKALMGVRPGPKPTVAAAKTTKAEADAEVEAWQRRALTRTG